MKATPDLSLLDTFEAAKYLGLKHPGTLCNWRSRKAKATYVLSPYILMCSQDMSHGRALAVPSIVL